jgi:hypothetical protein
LLILAPVAAAITALSVAPAATVHDVGLDGLDAKVDLTIGGGALEIDSGLLGALRRPSPTVWGKHVGIRVVPSDVGLRLFTSSGTVDPAAQRVIAHLFSDPAAAHDELESVRRQVVTHYLAAAGLAAGLVLFVEISGYAFLKHRRLVRRRMTPYLRLITAEDRRVDRVLARWVAAAAAVVCIVPALYVLSPLADRPVAIVPDPALTGTFAAGWQMTGPFTPVVLETLNAVDSLGKQEEAFYDAAAAHLQQSFATAYDQNSLSSDPDLVRVLFLDDLQGTSGMARIVGLAAGMYHAGAIVELGDVTATGTAQEAYLDYLKKYTVSELASYAGHVPVYASLGRHDTPAVAAALRKAGVSVADESVHPIAGVAAMGVNSAYIVEFGQAARLIDPAVTSATVSGRVASEGCAELPLLVYGHDSEDLDALAATGCVPIVVGGHSFTGQAPVLYRTAGRLTRQLVLGSTGGHGANDGFGGLSTPRNAAPFSVLSINKRTGAIGVDTVTVFPDTTVTLTHRALPALSAADLTRLSG